VLWTLVTGGDGDFDATTGAWGRLYLAASVPIETFLSLRDYGELGVSSPLGVWATWGLAVGLRLIVALGLLVLTSHRIRRLPTAGLVALMLLTFAAAAWWIIAAALDPPGFRGL
jgi:hypothetical protein